MIWISNQRDEFSPLLKILYPIVDLEASVLRNPWENGLLWSSKDRLKKYKKWLSRAIIQVPEVKREFERIRELYRRGHIVFLCNSYPSPSHGEIVRKFLHDQSNT